MFGQGAPRWKVDPREGRTQVAEEASQASWAPDNQTIVAGRPPPAEGLDILTVGKPGRKELTTVGRSPAWSPDNRFIAFVASVKDDDLEIDAVWLVPPSGGEPRRLVNGSLPHWSADGATLYYYVLHSNAVMAVDVNQTPPKPRLR
jgi:hypothetical protein